MALAELFRKYGVHSTRIGTWKRAAIENRATAFARKSSAPERVSAADVDRLHPKIGQLVVERDFLAPLVTLALARHRQAVGQKMVSRDHKSSLRKQCELSKLSRSRLYYRPVGERAENLRFMDIIDKQFLQTPWYGSRQKARVLKRQGHRCGGHRVRRLMRLVPICQEPNTSEKHPQHKIRPYLLRKMVIDRPNQVPLSCLQAAKRVRRHNLHLHAAGLAVSRGDHGLVQPQGAGLAPVEQHVLTSAWRL